MCNVYTLWCEPTAQHSGEIYTTMTSVVVKVASVNRLFYFLISNLVAALNLVSVFTFNAKYSPFHIRNL